MGREAIVTCDMVRRKELLPGDVFSTRGESYWSDAMWLGSLGEKAYIRTNVPCPPDQREVPIYRLRIDLEEGS